MDNLCLELDSAFLSATSDSPPDSTSPSSSFYQYSSPPSVKSITPSRKLIVSNISYRVPRNGSILTSVSFAARSSEILAVVGPSGAGKSTLLRVLSGRIEASQFNPTSISLNDRLMTSPAQLRKLCGFVTQEDNLLPLLTVKETLMFTAKFRLKDMSSSEKEERVMSLMQELGLDHIADSYVGDEEFRGISGGERKRVSIAVDVIHDPPVLLVDEPTSGLDSRSALQVVELLASMAKSRTQILILTIHQPSYRILGYVSTFLLLSHGTVAHYGSLKSLEETISRMGLKIPTQLNPLEYAMEITQQLEEHYDAKFSQEDCLDEELLIVDGEIDDRDRDPYCSIWQEVTSLAWRFWRIIYRTKQLFAARTMQAIVGGLGLGSVYLHVKTDADGVANRLGLFAFSLSFLLSSTVEALPIFLQERRVLMRESSRRMYRLSSYMFANTAVFLPFLLVVAFLFAVPVYWLVGLNPSLTAFLFFVLVVWMIVLMASSLVLFLSAISPDFMLGNSLISVFLGIFFLFSGYFIPKESIPKYWIFMYYVSLYKYPLDSLLINEYWSARQECFTWQQVRGRSVCTLTGGDILRGRGLEKDTRWVNVGIMCGFFLVYRVLCWILLERRASRTTL
ncbi:ABC transporter G family member 23 [Typha latifolia]|uniref:ABC transporter G family member 23 n=1 Tax=Typha latifolia TaxID=4733 RepID=UPI003C2E89A9